jgi:hypothetical protein
MQSDIAVAELGRIAIRHDRIHVRGCDHMGAMFRRQIGRTQDQPARHAVQFDERQCRGELIAGGDKNRPVAKLRAVTAETRSAREIAQGNTRIGSPRECDWTNPTRRLTSHEATGRHFAAFS